MRKTLYEHRRGKQMHASGQWSLTKAEQRLIYAVGAFFAISVISVLAGAFSGKSRFLTAAIICCVISFIAIFAVMFGVVTTENIEQAIARAGSKAGNKGYDVALGAIEMVNLIKQV